MGSQDHADLVRRGYAAFSSGDMATLRELFADDAVWHVPGSGSLSGPKHGRDAILAFFGELMARSGGTLKITLHDVIGGDQHTVALHHEFAESGSDRVDQNAANVFHVRGGRVTEVWELHEDSASSAWLWA
jgi:ketosteroid isomerase-like protein